MNELELSQNLSLWSHQALTWIGFGTLAGLLAKAIMPGRDPGGAVATVCMGVGGSVIGGGTLLFFNDTLRVQPISPIGFVVATGGAFVLLFFYRLLGGRFFREGDRGAVPPPYARRRVRRPRETLYHDDE